MCSASAAERSGAYLRSNEDEERLGYGHHCDCGGDWKWHSVGTIRNMRPSRLRLHGASVFNDTVRYRRHVVYRSPIVPGKPANNGGVPPPAESVEGRGLAKENTGQVVLPGNKGSGLRQLNRSWLSVIADLLTFTPCEMADGVCSSMDG